MSLVEELAVYIQPGDAIAVRTADIGGFFIRLGESWRYPRRFHRWNHYVMVRDAATVIEARGREGVVAWALATEHGWAEAQVWRPPHPALAARALARMEELEGEPYDWPMLVDEALILATGSRLRFGVAGEQICSGAVAVSYAGAGVPLGSDPAWLSPAALTAALDQLPGWRSRSFTR